MATMGAWVVKVSHGGKVAEKRVSKKISPESVMSGTRYKKEKYEILKHFLGEHIPDSMFLASSVEGDKGKIRPAEVTLQRRIDGLRLDQLADTAKDNPILHGNILSLMTRLQYMYSIIGEANARSAHNASIDAKLDLGGVSDFVRSVPLDTTLSMNDARRAAMKNKSPNILVDPKTLDVYCIDFDQGDWNEGMSGTKELAFNLDEQRRHARVK